MLNPPRVYVTRRIPDAGLNMVRPACDVALWPGDEPPPYETIIDEAREADGLLCLLTDRIDAALMDAAPRLRVISQYAVGVDNIDLAAATRRGIVVGNTPDVLTDATADMAFALLMAAARWLVEGVKYARAGRWRTWGPLTLLGQDIHGATLGIVGLGRIGQAVARRARGFDMRVLYHDCQRSAAAEREFGPSCTDLDTLLAESDFVTLHVPLTPQTHHLIGAAQFRQMKPTAVLINTSRGPVVDQEALVAALRAGTIGGAALDVTDPEPLPADHPLLALPNAIVTPHIASASVSARNQMAVRAADNLLAGLRGELPPFCVNPEALENRATRDA
ncbi:MAG: D-glycerate dehydrogenase [Chloroflexi bacterium]|nr:D-glycerate dehydrogenase [Chloroflexota bacterium]